MKKHTGTLNFMLSVSLIAVTLAVFVCFVYFVAFRITEFNGARITAFGLKIEVLLVVNLGLFLFAFLRRIGLSILVTTFLYIGFIFINLEKIKYLNTPVLPMDFKYLYQVVMTWNIFKHYLLITIITLIVSTGLVYLVKKIEKPISFFANSSKFKVFSLFMLIFISSIFFSGLQDNLLKLATNWKSRSHLVSTSEKYGLFTTFIRNLLHVVDSTKPNGYSKEKIKEIDLNINQIATQSTTKPEPVNVIIYLIESFIDPKDFGIKTTKDPIPFFHKLQKNNLSGFVYSPEVGGRSANAEFEILTGFSKHFFPTYSIPFIDLPNRPIPSIAWEFHKKDYLTKVIQASSLGYFNYLQVYEMLGFQEIVSLYQKEGVVLDIAGRYPSDLAIVDELIKSSKTKQNFFLYAFTNSTHGAWNYDAYDNSTLEPVLDQPLNSKKGEKHLKTYLNALNAADKAIKKLINYFEKKPEKTIILILGDHQPGLPEIREQLMFQKYPNRFNKTRRKRLEKQFLGFDENNPLDSYETMHKVPYVIWSNFEFETAQKTLLGMNELAIKIFELTNHQPKSPFYKFMNDFVNDTDYTDLLKYIYLQKNSLTSESLKIISFYEQIQYDLIFGHGYINDIHNDQ